MRKELRDRQHNFLKDTIRKTINFSETDQSRGIDPPPIEKPYPPEKQRTQLPLPDAWRNIGKVDLIYAIENRKSRRFYSKEPFDIEELAFLLWATQGVRRVLGPGTALRTVPSAGSRHALETYLCVLRVKGLENGIYRYLPLEHQLLHENHSKTLKGDIVRACFDQPYPGNAAVTFIWTAIPYRMEWRYGMAAHKVIALDAGHVCQNLYLACEAIQAGVCAIAAYDQEEMDHFLEVDGNEEFTIYIASAGKVAENPGNK